MQGESRKKRPGCLQEVEKGTGRSRRVEKGGKKIAGPSRRGLKGIPVEKAGVGRRCGQTIKGLRNGGKESVVPEEGAE